MLWTAAALGVLWEWCVLVPGAGRRGVLVMEIATVLFAMVFLVGGHAVAAVVVLAAGQGVRRLLGGAGRE